MEFERAGESFLLSQERRWDSQPMRGHRGGLSEQDELSKAVRTDRSHARSRTDLSPEFACIGRDMFRESAPAL
jgi:hypothetical protein